MKTKILLFFIIFSFYRQNYYAQTYIPMLNNSSWVVTTANFGGSSNSIITTGPDIVIGAYTYKQFIDPTYLGGTVYLREDVANKKVYRNINGTDQLLYDFSLLPSSSITLPNGRTYTVTVSTINVNGGTRKEFNLYNFLGGETWVEGVGSLRNPLRPTYELFSDPYVYVTCSAQNGVAVYNHGLANGGTPTDCSLLLNTIETMYNEQAISIFPNPFTSTLTLQKEDNFENASLKIINSFGQIVKELDKISGNKITIQRDNLENGVYLAQITENDKIQLTKKIIIIN